MTARHWVMFIAELLVVVGASWIHPGLGLMFGAGLVWWIAHGPLR